MIPTETEGPAKLAWHKSTRIKKKELQSDFTQDFGLDRIRGRNSREERLTGEELIIKIAPPPTLLSPEDGVILPIMNKKHKPPASIVSRNTCVFCFTVYEKNANPILPMSCAISMMTTRLPILNNQAFTMPSALHKPRRMPPGSG